jgi:hypothetical protein
VAVWEGHLLPLLTRKDAARRLGRTCKALRGMVREHFRDIGTIKVDLLKAALTTFPRARKVTLGGSAEGWWEAPQKEELVQWLHEGGRGRHLERVGLEGYIAAEVIHKALRGGALPSLKGVDACLSE